MNLNALSPDAFEKYQEDLFQRRVRLDELRRKQRTQSPRAHSPARRAQSPRTQSPARRAQSPARAPSPRALVRRRPIVFNPAYMTVDEKSEYNDPTKSKARREEVYRTAYKRHHGRRGGRRTVKRRSSKK